MSTPASDILSSLLLVGVCGAPHGVRGEVKVIPETDDPGRLIGLDRLWLGPAAASARERAVDSVRLQTTKRGEIALVHLDGVSTPEEAGTLRHLLVFAHEDDLPPLEDGEVFLHDLIGLTALVDGEPVGTVSNVLDATAQPLLVIKRDGRPDALVPDVPEIVAEVDLDAGTLTLTPPEGLLD